MQELDSKEKTKALKVNVSLDEDNDYIIEAVKNNFSLIKDEVKNINNIFSYTKTKDFLEHKEELKQRGYDLEIVISNELLNMMISDISKTVFDCYDIENKTLDENKLKEVYKNDFKYYYRYLLEKVIERFKEYNYNNTNKDKLITFKPEDLSNFTTSLKTILNNIYTSYANIKYPDTFDIDKKEFTLMFEDIFKFNVYEKKIEENLTDVKSNDKFQMAKLNYNVALNYLKNKPRVLENKKNDPYKWNFNEKVETNYLLKIRNAYKEIERIHSTRHWYEALIHPIIYIKEKRFMSKIVSNVNKMYKNTRYMERAKDIVKADDNNYQVLHLGVDERVKKTELLLSASQALFGSIDENDKFGIDIENRDYLEQYKEPKKMENNKANIEVDEINGKKEQVENIEKPKVYYRDITINDVQYKEL